MTVIKYTLPIRLFGHLDCRPMNMIFWLGRINYLSRLDYYDICPMISSRWFHNLRLLSMIEVKLPIVTSNFWSDNMCSAPTADDAAVALMWLILKSPNHLCCCEYSGSNSKYISKMTYFTKQAYSACFGGFFETLIKVNFSKFLSRWKCSGIGGSPSYCQKGYCQML